MNKDRVMLAMARALAWYEVIARANVSAAEKSVLAAIVTEMNFSNEDRKTRGAPTVEPSWAHVPIRSLAAMAGMSQGSARRVLARLCRTALVSRENPRHKSRSLYAVLIVNLRMTGPAFRTDPALRVVRMRYEGMTFKQIAKKRGFVSTRAAARAYRRGEAMLQVWRQAKFGPAKR